MGTSAAVGVHNDLATGQAAVALGASDHKTAGGVDQVFGIDQPLFGQHGLDDFFDDGFGEAGLHLVRGFALIGAVLGGQHHGVDAVGHAVHIAQRDLALGIGAQKGQAAVFAQLGLALHQAVCVINRGGHQLGRFVAGITKHQALVARAGIQMVVGRLVHALGNVVGLLVVANHHRTAFVVDAVVGVVVADALDGVARHLDVVHMRVGGDFTGQHDQAGVGQGFSGHAAARVLFENCVQNRVRNLIGHLVGVTFRNGFRGKEIIARHVHEFQVGLRGVALSLVTVANALAVGFYVALQVVQ